MNGKEFMEQLDPEKKPDNKRTSYMGTNSMASLLKSGNNGAKPMKTNNPYLFQQRKNKPTEGKNEEKPKTSPNFQMKKGNYHGKP